jgi:hypothetical protein
MVILFSTRGNAQFDNIRFPQTEDEITLFRDNRVMGETEFSLEKEKKIPYYSRAFDPGGHVVISADYYHRQYYIYDDKGNVISFLDSVRNNKGSFDVSEYRFRYFNNGKLLEATGPGIHSTFTYNPDKNVLTETQLRNDSTFINKFEYDINGRLMDAKYSDFLHQPVMHITKTFSADGRLFNESITTVGKEFNDSTLTIYEYNDKKQLFQKHRFRFQVYFFSTRGEGKPDRSASHYDDAISKYDLDDKGRPIAEEFTIKGDKLNYRYNTWKYNKTGLLTKETTRIGNAEPKTILHEYIYFDQK